MESVYLRYPHNEFYVDDQTYQEIYQLVKVRHLCKREWHPFSEDNPCVGQNLCLKHLLERHGALTFLGEYRTDTYGRHMYRYLDPQGYIYTSTEESSTDAEQDRTETLYYHGFAPPETITYRDNTAEYSSYYARLYGNIATASVIILSFEKKSSETVKGVFLLYNDGTHKELAKRGEHKQLFTRAYEILEATKDKGGTYHLPPNGYTTTVLHDDDCYPIISQLESAMFNVMRQFQPGKPKQEEKAQEEVVA